MTIDRKVSNSSSKIEISAFGDQRWQRDGIFPGSSITGFGTFIPKDPKSENPGIFGIKIDIPNIVFGDFFFKNSQLSILRAYP